MKNLYAVCVASLLCIMLTGSAHAQKLKSIVYDFDGLDIGQNDLPEGDYKSGDLTYQASADPLTSSDMLSDRVLKIDLNWNTGTGIFGRGISRFIDLDVNQDVFNFYFYNPSSNNQNAVLNVVITDDDNQNNTYESTSDDIWQKTITITPASYWQHIAIPLNYFTDANAGGNGVFDITFSQNKGMLLMNEFQFLKDPAATGNATFYMDMLSFSEGSLPHGATDLDLPSRDPSDYCWLGAYMKEAVGQEYLIPSQFESLFPSVPGKKIRYVNYFLDWSMSGGTTANQMPGNEVQILLSNGYRPIITWEPMFQGYSRLDPVQPRLSNILNGDYDVYIDSFADRLKNYNDTIIVRFMHEFEGDWYPWSLSQNNQDPLQYIAAYQKVVNRVRARGASKIKWMWCVNSDYAPYEFYNWIVPAYPGNNYVDIIASDIYNNHFPVSLPYWKSFRMQCTESYYYLTKNFPNKDLYICEVGCRERFNTEDPSSQSKGDWYARMDKEMQSNFHKARALIFFNDYPDQNWFVNSSSWALQSLTNNVWNDNYYFPAVSGIATNAIAENYLYVYPNPTDGVLTINYFSGSAQNGIKLRLIDALGNQVYGESINGVSFVKQLDISRYPKGIYFVELFTNVNGASAHEIRKIMVE